MEKPRILVGIPAQNLEVISRDFFDCVLEMDKPEGTKVVTQRGHSIAEVRNALAEEAVSGNYSHLLMLDADMYYPKDTITALLNDRVGIVCGFSCQRVPPYDYVVFGDRECSDEWAVFPAREDEIPASGTFRVGACGGAALLVNTAVFSELEKPWFSREAVNEKGATVSEDIYFSLKARRAGFQCHMNLNVRVGHLFSAMVIPAWDTDVGQWRRLLCQTAKAASERKGDAT